MFDEQVSSKRLKIAIAVYLALLVPGCIAFYMLILSVLVVNSGPPGFVVDILINTLWLYPISVLAMVVLGFVGLKIKSERVVWLAVRFPIFTTSIAFCISVFYFLVYRG